MISNRRNREYTVVEESEEGNVNDRLHVASYDQTKLTSPSESSTVQPAIDFPELKLVVSDSFSSKFLPKKKNLTENPLYYTGNIDEGFASTEVVTAQDIQTNVQNEDAEDIYIATPVEILEFSSSTSNIENEPLTFQTFPTNQRRKRQTKSDSFLFKGFDFQTSSEPDSASDESESDEEFLTLLSDNETHLSFSSSISGESDDQDRGNLPNFGELDVAVTVETKFSSPPNPLVSKRIPTATFTYQTEQGSSDTRVSLMPVISTTEKTLKEIQESLVTKSDIRQTIESSGSKFCSTNVQSALLGKLTTVSDKSDLNMVTSFILPESPLGFGKKTKSPTKLKSPKRIKTVKGRHDFGIDVEHDLLTLETEVDKAFKESVNEGSVMPLLKQELQYKIQVQRLSRGESELILGHEEPKKYELTPEEMIKKEQRLEQNRRSADKSRQKAKQQQEMLLKTIKADMTENARLKGELACLVKMRDKLKAMVDDHMKTCKQASEEKSG